MPVNHVVYGTTTIIDIRDSTVDAEHLSNGYVAYDHTGARIVGTAQNASVVITEETTEEGGTIKHIITDNSIDLSGDTVTPATLLSGYTAHNRSGAAITGTYVPPAEPVYQSKTATPTESQQTVTPDSNYDALSSVTVGAISSTYVGSGVTRKAAATYNTSTSDQTIASGQYLTGAQTIKAVTTSNLTAANVKAGTTIMVGDANDADRIASVTGTFTSDATATAADINSGVTAYVNGSKVTGSQVIQHYYTGAGTPSASLGVDGDIYLQTS